MEKEIEEWNKKLSTFKTKNDLKNNQAEIKNDNFKKEVLGKEDEIKSVYKKYLNKEKEQIHL